jgi:tetratricopeptide (TPR) repeat protein
MPVDQLQKALEVYERGILAWSEGRQDEALACFEQALAGDPGIAERPYQEGLERAQAGELAEAEGWLWLAHLFRPQDVATLSCLGDVLRQLGRVGEAVPLLEQGVAVAPGSWQAHADLGLALCDLDRLSEAGAALERAISLHGLDARLAVNLAMVRKAEGRVEESLSLVEEAIRMQPEFAAAHVNRAHLLLMTGRFEEGWQEYEWRPQKRLSAGKRLGEWEGRTVLLHQEQGAGDLIQFIRYAALLEGAKVMVSCDERFIPLMRGARGVADAVSWTGQLPELDLEANVMSLPRILGSDFGRVKVPYLEVDPERVAAWRERLSGEKRFRVGLVWGGNPANPVERRRGISLRRMAEILAISGVAFYALQQGPQRRELEEAIGVVDLASECEQVTEAAAATMNLDLIISTDTMPAHLAGALGRPVWVLLHYMADWRWMVGHEESAWYPSMRLFRQAEPGEWGGVVSRVAEALRASLWSVGGTQRD